MFDVAVFFFSIFHLISFARAFGLHAMDIFNEFTCFYQCFGSGSGSGSARIRLFLACPDPDPVSLTIWQVFCLVDFSFFKFILKNAHFLNILVNFWVLWKNVENFLIPGSGSGSASK